MVALAECQRHDGPAPPRELVLAPRVFESLGAGMPCLGDCMYISHRLWAAARVTGTTLLLRSRNNVGLPVRVRLPDGYYPSWLFSAAMDRRHGGGGIAVRVIEYVLDDPGRSQDSTTFRLITTILDSVRTLAKRLSATRVTVHSCGASKQRRWGPSRAWLFVRAGLLSTTE